MKIAQQPRIAGFAAQKGAAQIRSIRLRQERGLSGKATRAECAGHPLLDGPYEESQSGEAGNAQPTFHTKIILSTAAANATPAFRVRMHGGTIRAQPRLC